MHASLFGCWDVNDSCTSIFYDAKRVQKNTLPLLVDEYKWKSFDFLVGLAYMSYLL